MDQSLLRPYIKKALWIIAILFSLYSCLIITDFFLPPHEHKSKIEDLFEERTPRARRYGGGSSYTLTFDNTSFSIDQDTYNYSNIGDQLLIQRSFLLGHLMQAENITASKSSVNVYKAPFSFFPIFPIIFMLPLVQLLVETKSNHNTKTRRIKCFGLAIIGVAMVIF